MEACPQFPLSAFNDFASLTVQKHILDHWERDKIPTALREVMFTPQVSWKKVGKQWESCTAPGAAHVVGLDPER